MSTLEKLTKGKARKPREGLTEQEEAYCRVYVLNGGNGAEAIAEAMPHTRAWSPQRRAVRSSQLKAQSKISERIAALTAIVRQKADGAFAMKAEEVIAHLTMLATGTLRDFIQVDEAGRPTITLKDATATQMYALNEVTIEDIETGKRTGTRTKIKLGDRIAALRLLGQHHQLFGERVEHQHEHHLLLEHAARDLDNKLALLISRRAEERRESVEEAEVIEVRAAARPAV
jgi:hypothetical protein